MDDGAALGRCRTIVPDAVDRVGGHRDEAAVFGRERRFEAADLGDSVQEGIVADALSGRRRIQIFGERDLDRGNRFEDVEVDLLAHLQRIATIDEDRGTGREHHGHAGRAGKPGEPLQPRGRGRDVFALVLVGTRHEEAVDTGRLKAAAQTRDAPGAAGEIGDLVEALEHGSCAFPAVLASSRTANRRTNQPARADRSNAARPLQHKRSGDSLKG